MKSEKHNPTRASKLLQVVHTDLCGPMSTNSFGGARYFMAIVDDWSQYTVTYFLSSKSQALDKFVEYVESNRAATGQQLKTV